MSQVPFNLPGSAAGTYGRGLRLRPGAGQDGNHISVREAPNQDGGWGTLVAPRMVQLPLAPPALRLQMRLGYQAVPSTDVLGFETKSALRLQANRISGEPYVVHVAVALLDANNRRVVSLVDTADGRGVFHLIDPGYYKIVVSLGMPVDVNFELRLAARPGVVLAARDGRGGTPPAAGSRLAPASPLNP